MKKAKKNWHWIELIGFDVESPDYGVGAFFSRLHDKPEGISLLFSHIDFVNGHKNGDYVLDPCYCSYHGHPRNAERERQVWTSRQLQALVAELKSRGAKVIFSIFDMGSYADGNGQKIITPFVAAHPELRSYGKSGRQSSTVNPLHRFNGRPYAEFFARKALEVIEFYGFDGIQLADGISCSRPSVGNGDFSDEMVSQFRAYLAESDRPVSKKLAAVGDDTEKYAARRKYILKKLYFEYLLFCNSCWKIFYDRFYETVDPKEHIIFINSFWTRDPFEAFYRYGIDYRTAYRDGVYALMVEENSALYPSFSVESRGGFHLSLEKTRYAHYEYYMMQMMLKAYLPYLRQISLLPIADTMEDWNALRDNGNELRRSILRRNNCAVYAGGKYRPCAEAPFFCLSDCVSAHDWESLAALDSKAFLEDMDLPRGYSVYLSREGLLGEVERYADTRDYGVYKLACELASRSAQIASVITEEDLASYKQPLLVLFPEYCSEKEQELFAATDTPCVFISNRLSFGRELYRGQITVSARNIDALPDTSLLTKMQTYEGIRRCMKSYEDPEGGIWTAPLKYNEWNPKFTSALARMINLLLPIPEIKPRREYECKLTGFAKKDGSLILLISNDEYYNARPTVVFPEKVTSARSLTKYAGYPLEFDENSVTVGVSPRSMEIIEVRCETEKGRKNYDRT